MATSIPKPPSKGNILLAVSLVTMAALILAMCLSKTLEQAMMWFVASAVVYPIVLGITTRQDKKEKAALESAAQEALAQPLAN